MEGKATRGRHVIFGASDRIHPAPAPAHSPSRDHFLRQALHAQAHFDQALVVGGWNRVTATSGCAAGQAIFPCDFFADQLQCFHGFCAPRSDEGSDFENPLANIQVQVAPRLNFPDIGLGLSESADEMGPSLV